MLLFSLGVQSTWVHINYGVHQRERERGSLQLKNCVKCQLFIFFLGKFNSSSNLLMMVTIENVGQSFLYSYGTKALHHD